MSDQYDLATAKISAALEMVMAAFENGKPSTDPEANLRLLTDLFQLAFDRITDAVGPTLRQDIIPGPPDTSTI